MRETNQKTPPAPESPQGEKKEKGIAIEIPKVSLPQGGGAIKGIDELFKVNSSNGTASFSVKIPITAARNECSPSLALNYNSGSGNSIAGIGWSLDFPSIQRRTDKQLPTYDDMRDVFMVSGAEELVPALRWNAIIQKWEDDADLISGYQVKRYRPRVEGHSLRVERISQGTEVWWRTISKDNRITYYGCTASSRLHDPSNPSHIFQWLPEFHLDDRGNCIQYVYKVENFEGVANSLPERNRLNGNAPTRNLYLKRILHGNASPCYRVAVHALIPPVYSGAFRFETVLDYGEHSPSNPLPAETPGLHWECRPDAFSTCRGGFEVRTYRRLHRVLMFHQFPSLNDGQSTLVKSMDLTFTGSGVGAGQDTELSYLTRVQQCGYRRIASGQYSKKTLPALEFSYQPLHWDNTIHTVDATTREGLPTGVDGSYQWLDLWGEGISGVFTEQASGWHYKRNAGDLNEDGTIHLEQSELVAPRPSFHGMGSGGDLSLQDLDANGRKQIVVQAAGLHGYFELDDNLEWLPFKSFPQVLNRPKTEPHQRSLDLSGDGKADILISEETAMVWYENLGSQGFGPAQRTAKAGDEERGPALVFADNTQSVFLADMSGDGMQDIVRIRNGEVSYWPNLGFGRFGARVSMANAPVFANPDLFDPNQIKLADLSGTGNTDLLYLSTDGCAAWINLSGNAWSDAQHITPFMTTERPIQVSVSDILGNGTSCIVWSSNLPAHANAPLRYLDLMGGKKPHLLTTYVNNLGKEVRLHYKSSTWFYNKDRAAGKPWITRLPFPVHCLRQVETLDHVEGVRFVSEYSYHHGYYDQHEREFRGFGRVDQLDTEVFEHWVKSGATNIVDASLHQPPVMTRTWHHLGAGIDRERLLSQFAEEYWPKEMARQGFAVAVTEPSLPEGRIVMAPHLLPAAVNGLDEVEWREAMRACKGMVLRQEVFALDAPAQNPTLAELQLQLSPFSVATHNCIVELYQPRNGQRNAVFVVKESEALTLTYDRNLSDPRIGHTLNVRLDELGNVLEKASIAYGRKFAGANLPAETVAAQSMTTVLYQANAYTQDISTVHDFRLRQGSEERQFEIKGLQQPGTLYTLADFDKPGFNVVLNSNTKEYEDFDTPAPFGTVTRRLLKDVRTYFLAADLVSALPLHSQLEMGLVAEKYQMAFTPSLLTNVYGAKVDQAKLTETQYIQIPGDGNWWIKSGISIYLNQGESAGAAATRFFTPVAMQDPRGAKTLFKHFGTDFLLLQETEDAAQNRNRVMQYDLRLMQAQQTRDANLNLTEVLFDELGRVKAVARMGKGNQGDDLSGLLGYEDMAESGQLATYLGATTPTALAAAANPLLAHATMRFVYDWDRYASSGGTLPAVTATISREEYFTQNNNSPVQLKFEYANAAGKVTMTKAQAEPGLAKQVTLNPNGTITVSTIDTSAGPQPQNRWIGNGRKVMNNKGNVVKEYEPYFAVSHQYENYKELVETGKGSLTRYDAAGRPFQVDHPDGTFTSVIYDRWRKEASDRNDNVLKSTWYHVRVNHLIDAELTAAGKNPSREAAAALQAATHANTPTSEYLDPQGQSIMQIAHNGKDGMNQDILLRGRITRDAQGQARENYDALDRLALKTKYDMAGRIVMQHSLDSADRWILPNIANEPAYEWDSRLHEFHSLYADPLHRLTEKRVTGGDDLVMNHVIERNIYGEGLPNDQSLNLRGQKAVVYDSAGKIEFRSFDFDGKITQQRRTFASDYRHAVNWPQVNPDALLEVEFFDEFQTHDALGRMRSHTTADGSVCSPTYNAANLLQSLQVTRLGATETFVQNMDYSEKGQRTRILFGNNVTADYLYDVETSRVVRIHTYRQGGTTLQDLNYTYDAEGNLTHLMDEAVPTIFWANQMTNGLCTYTYDPTYRLIHATGREHAAVINFGQADNWNDLPFLRQLSPNDQFVWRNYSQDYAYDLNGNLTSISHNAPQAGYSRTYSYVTGTNRLDFTTVNGVNYHCNPHAQHGFATSLPHLSRLRWNFRDEIVATATQVVNSGEPETTWYVYDGQGQRVRKVTDRSAAQGANPAKKEERYYLGTVELYRDYDNAGGMDVERWTLHVSDDKQRIALVDNRTHGQVGLGDAHLVRYQCPNHLSSSSLEVDQIGRIISYEEHHPFGTTSYQATNATINAAAKRYRFTAMERDEESGLEYHSARYYAPWLGRWLSADKLGSKQSGNRYAYVSNNPVKFMDTNGMFEEPAHGALTYRLAIAAGFEPKDAATIALATAAMDHDQADKPGGDENLKAYLDGVEHIFSGSTQGKHFDAKTAEARFDANSEALKKDKTQGALKELGRSLHTLEDVGTKENPGPHMRGPKRMSTDLLAVSLTAFSISAILIGNGAAGSFKGVGWNVASVVLGGLLALIGYVVLQFSIAAQGVGHGTYTTERGKKRGYGGESSWTSHVADQFFQDPEANKREMLEIYGKLKKAAENKYGGKRKTDDAGALKAIEQLGAADTLESIDKYMHEGVRRPNGTMAPSYAEILPTRGEGAWKPSDMDITVEDDPTKYSDWHKKNRPNEP